MKDVSSTFSWKLNKNKMWNILKYILIKPETDLEISWKQILLENNLNGNFFQMVDFNRSGPTC